MRLILAAAAILAAASPALAQERLSDSAFISASRCEGMLGAKLDDSAKTFIKSQAHGREAYILDRARDARLQGKRLSRSASVKGCVRYAAKPATSTASASAPASSAQN